MNERFYEYGIFVLKVSDQITKPYFHFNKDFSANQKWVNYMSETQRNVLPLIFQ